MNWLTICEGRNLQACTQCKRHVERHSDKAGKLAPVFAMRDFLQPRVVNPGRCADFVGAPARGVTR